MSAKSLPPSSNLTQLKNQAKDLLKAHKVGDEAVCSRIREHFPKLKNASDEGILHSKFVLQDAQLVIAREHQFKSWPELKTHINTEEFVNACHDGNLDEAKRLLPEADINGENQHGQGALLSFHPEVTEFLLNNGADPNQQKNEGGLPVLFGLCYVANHECVKKLLAAGANPNQPNKKTGETVLHQAATSMSTECVRLLLEAGGDPNARTNVGVPSGSFWRDVNVVGETPLHRAAAYGDEEMMRILVEAGADPTIKDANGDSPLTWFSRHQRDKEHIKVSTSAMKYLAYGEFTQSLSWLDD